MSVETIHSVSAVSALILVTACLITDLSYRRIPNILTLPAVVVGLLLGVLGGGWNGLLLAFAGLLVGFGLMFLPYYLGGMGAGDVKLMSAVGALVGVPTIVNIFLYSALAGGVLALVTVLRRRVAMKAVKNAFALLASFVLLRSGGVKSQAGELSPRKSVGAVPYGVAIALGTYAYYLFGSVL